MKGDRELVIKKLAAIKNAKHLSRLVLNFGYENRNRDREDIKGDHPKWSLFYRLFSKLLDNEVLWPLVYAEIYPEHEGLPFIIPPMKLEENECEIKIEEIYIFIDEDFEVHAKIDFIEC